MGNYQNWTKESEPSEEAYKKTEEKVNTSFEAGYGTILFFVDQSVIKGLQDKLPIYAHKFEQWSEHSSAIVQIMTWMGLESVGFGASLQHYNPLIDEAVKKRMEPWPKMGPYSPNGFWNASRWTWWENAYTPLEKRLFVFM